MLDVSSFRLHIEMQDRESKHDRAMKLYSNYTFDTALPQHWVMNFISRTIYTQDEIVSQFVWLYFQHDSMGQPAPLTLKACDMLEAFNKATQ